MSLSHGDTSSNTSSKPTCGKVQFGGEHVCQLPAGHDGSHLDDRGPNTVVGWPQTIKNDGKRARILSNSGPSMQIPVENNEMVTVRDAMRTLNQIVDEIQEGLPFRKAVLMRHNRMVAVVLSVVEYRNLLASRFSA